MMVVGICAVNMQKQVMPLPMLILLKKKGAYKWKQKKTTTMKMHSIFNPADNYD